MNELKDRITKIENEFKIGLLVTVVIMIMNNASPTQFSDGVRNFRKY